METLIMEKFIQYQQLMTSQQWETVFFGFLGSVLGFILINSLEYLRHQYQQYKTFKQIQTFMTQFNTTIFGLIGAVVGGLLTLKWNKTGANIVTTMNNIFDYLVETGVINNISLNHQEIIYEVVCTLVNNMQNGDNHEYQIEQKLDTIQQYIQNLQQIFAMNPIPQQGGDFDGSDYSSEEVDENNVSDSDDSNYSDEKEADDVSEKHVKYMIDMNDFHVPQLPAQI
jgi:hypothetical protein